MQALELLATFIGPLEESRIPYFVTGSIASIFYGEPRLTHDIDIVIHLDSQKISEFSAKFPLEHYYCPPEEVLQIELKRRPYGHFNLIHHKTGLKADLYPDAEDSLHKWAFHNRRRIDLVDFGNPFQLWLALPEYVIVRKLEYFREGSSQKHLDDIKKMLPQIADGLNVKELEDLLKKRGLLELWKQL